MPLSQTSHPRPQAPRVGDSQLSSTKRTSCTCGSNPSARRLSRYNSSRSGGEGFITPGTGSSAAAGTGSLRSGRRSGGARLHVGRAPGFRPDRAQEGRGVKRTRAHLHVVGLQDHAAALGPIALQGKNQVLKSTGLGADLRCFHQYRDGSNAAREYKRGQRQCQLDVGAALCRNTRRSCLHYTSAVLGRLRPGISYSTEIWLDFPPLAPVGMSSASKRGPAHKKNL